MKNKMFQTFAAFCVALTFMVGLSVPAFAQGPDQPPAEDATNDSNVVVEETEPAPPLTPEGNAALVDDFGGNKQLITITTKSGNYFYILIDRANEDKETAVHFLNQVDEADLMALTENEKKEPPTCSCTDRCHVGAVNTKCELCAKDMTLCVGKEAEPEKPEEPPVPEEKPQGLNPAVLVLLFVLIGGGGAFAYFKFVKNKPQTKGNDDLDDYDYGEDDDTDDGEEWETEDTTDDSTEESEEERK